MKTVQARFSVENESNNKRNRKRKEGGGGEPVNRKNKRRKKKPRVKSRTNKAISASRRGKELGGNDASFTLNMFFFLEQQNHGEPHVGLCVCWSWCECVCVVCVCVLSRQFASTSFSSSAIVADKWIPLFFSPTSKTVALCASDAEEKNRPQMDTEEKCQAEEINEGAGRRNESRSTPIFGPLLLPMATLQVRPIKR